MTVGRKGPIGDVEGPEDTVEGRCEEKDWDFVSSRDSKRRKPEISYVTW